MEAAPTGCYKCGRPSHWSRDCPFSPPNPDNSSSLKPSAGAGANSSGGSSVPAPSKFPQKPVDKPKRVPRTRPKLTPNLLLSDDGLGYVLHYFPRAFKYRGRGDEVEQVAATKRVKTCLRELRERVANGGDHKIPKFEDLDDEKRSHGEEQMAKE